MSQSQLRALSVAAFILVLGSMTFNLYGSHQSLSACHGQLARLDAIEAQIDGMKQ